MIKLEIENRTDMNNVFSHSVWKPSVDLLGVLTKIDSYIFYSYNFGEYYIQDTVLLKVLIFIELKRKCVSWKGLGRWIYLKMLPNFDLNLSSCSCLQPVW